MELTYTQCNYEEQLNEDIREYIKENYESEELDFDTLYYDMFTSDSITGNASGSYTFNTYKAQENLVGNWGYVVDMIQEDYISKENLESPESIDVCIRCYLLAQVLTEVLEELENH